MPDAGLPLLWFIAIIAMIPLVLWLLKRTPLGGSATGGTMRTVAAMAIAPNQRIVTIEVGSGEDRRWLVLGVTAQQITTLHTMPPQAEAPTAGAAGAPFAQVLAKLQGRGPTPPGGPGAV